MLAGAGHVAALAKSDAAGLRSIEAEGTQFRVTLSDGRALGSPELLGATLVIGVTMRRLQPYLEPG